MYCKPYAVKYMPVSGGQSIRLKQASGLVREAAGNGLRPERLGEGTNQVREKNWQER
jgi:hypothetical protein